MMALYLIRRGPRPEYHKAPFHPVLVCDRKRTARDEVGNSQAAAWLWEYGGRSIHRPGYGWLLFRWNGLEIDYSPVVSANFTLPDGSEPGFWRDYRPLAEGGVQDLLAGAVWWSDRRMPAWLMERGVVYPADFFTQQRILDRISDDGIQGWDGRTPPSFWPVAERPAEGMAW